MEATITSRSKLTSTLELLRSQLQNVKKDTDGQMKTHGNFKFNPSTTGIN